MRVHMLMKSRKGHGIAAAALILLLEIGCSRPVTVPNDASQSDRHQAPFQSGTAKPANPGPAEPSVVQAESGPAVDKLPFRERENLPAGTLISVRLTNPISIVEIGGENSSFEAIVVAPVVVDGATLIPKGTPVTGRIESIRTSQLKPTRGYVRLALASVHAGGIDVPVQTASLFARQSPSSEQPSSMIGLEKGRRLTFSVSEPAYIAGPQAKSEH